MSLSVGLNCPACGGAIKVDEGEHVLNCQYCGSTLWAEGDAGVLTVAYKNMQDRDAVLRATEQWWRKGLKARDLRKKGRLLECYPIYLPFWSTVTRVAGWICGYEERTYQDRDGHSHTERIPKEEMVLNDYSYTNIACDPGDLGIKRLRNIGARHPLPTSRAYRHSRARQARTILSMDRRKRHCRTRDAMLACHM